MKFCIKCQIEKDEFQFPFRDRAKIIRRNECKLCIKQYRSNYYKQNKEILLKGAKEYYYDNKDLVLEYSKKYRKKNKSNISESKKTYYINNKSAIKKYQLANKNKIQSSANKRRRYRRKNDPLFKLRTYISNIIRRALKKNKSDGTWKNIPYTINELKIHLEQQFKPWMSWENHGVYDSKNWNDNDPSTWTWQIDHIIPHSDLPYLSVNDENFKKCWALQNLRPLSSKQNIIDGASRIRHK